MEVSSSLRIEDARAHQFIFSFISVEQKDLILSQGPWNFKGSYMILQEWDPNQTLDEVDLSTVVFSVQIHGLPLEIVDVENARLIGSKLGVILEMDDVEAHHSFIRLKIKFHTSASLEPRFYFPRLMGNLFGLVLNMSGYRLFVFIVG